MSAFLTLECPTCGARAAFASGADRIVCAYCGNEHLFKLPTSATSPAPAASRAPAAAPASRSLAPRPNEVTIQKQGQGLKLSWRWFSAKYIGLAIFAVVWDAFLCFWYSAALSGSGMPWIMIVFPLGHVAVGVGITYSVIAGFLNRTTLAVDRNVFTVHHDPVPWFGEVKVKPADLDQLYCKEKISHGKNGTSTSYQLCAVLKDGRKLDLVSGLDSPDVALFIEQQVEDWLRIEDRSVPGEMRAGKW